MLVLTRRSNREALMRIRRIAISAAFTAGLATLSISTAKAQYYPPPCSPFPLSWPFCVVGRCHWHRRDDRHRAGLGDNGSAALLLQLLWAALFPTAGLFYTTVLPAPVLLPATLSPRLAPVSLLSYVLCRVRCSTNRLIT